jgi:hypothetical protein
MVAIFEFAAKSPIPPRRGAIPNRPEHQAIAHDFLLLIGDQRFCRVVVDKVPAFAFVCFLKSQKYRHHHLPIFQFARNVGQEFIRNTTSSFYQEDSGYYSGFVGYVRPVTRIIFGSFEFVEQCAVDGASPLDTDYREFHAFNPTQMEGYTRASLAFLESCLVVTKGRAYPHSYALARMFGSLETAISGTYAINGMVDFINMPAYGHLRVVVDFINRATTLVSRYADRPRTLRISKPSQADIYDDLAESTFKTIFAASTVTTPPWTSWSIQHNTVWSDLFGFKDSAANKIIALKVRRLLYNEIKRMDQFANFKGARILGYCLHVLGLAPTNRHTGYHRECYPLQAAALGWAKANFKRLLADHPRVAKACLQGSVSYDSDTHRLVKSFENATEKEPQHEFLELD